MRKKYINYFKYASVDYMIDKDGFLNFLEVNDNTLAPYFIEKKSEIVERDTAAGNPIFNLNRHHKLLFLDCFRKNLKEGQQIAIVCKEKGVKSGIENEVQYIKKLFNQNGFQADIYTPDDFIEQEGELRIKKTGEKPDLIFRRNFSFPESGLSINVINDLCVRNIANDKFKVLQSVRLLEKYFPVLRVPETYKAEYTEEILKWVFFFQQKGEDCIIKPNCLYGGQGLLLIKCSDSKEEVYRRIGQINPVEGGYIVQRKIEAARFRSGNSKKYCFDIRCMVYGGRMAGIEGRRSGVPFAENEEKGLITNIARNGVDLIVVSGPVSRHNYAVRKMKCEGELSSLDFKVDRNYLMLSYGLVKCMRNLSERIVEAVDSQIKNERIEGKENA
ncbi:ATP-grasp domain-containing protein [Anaerovorax sp. IOR16]|uniref:ATP-grasp domain-containing protein n=1 Tax=Anaerovorax sp. IOR16 TaxID=2773458 RepID=UPI0019CF8430|nr:hypothetical protein [Anaerovorax sp. IOR16]